MGATPSWDPLRELLSVQKRMNKLFETAFERTDFETHGEVDTWTPVADVYDLPDALEICLELPGLRLEQIDLRVEGDELVVAGERELGREGDGERFHRVERAYGKFSRRFHLPSTVDRAAVTATYRDGLLRVKLPHDGERRGAVRVDIR